MNENNELDLNITETESTAPETAQPVSTNDITASDFTPETAPENAAEAEPAASVQTEGPAVEGAPQDPQPATDPEQQWSYTYNRDNTLSASAEPTPQKLRSRNAGIAWLIVLCVLFSGLAGFGGGWFANRLTTAHANATPETSETITQTVLQINSEDGMSMVELAAKVTPTVVQITTEYTVENFWMQSTATGAGSGVIITDDGTIVTNNHVVENATSIVVTLHNGDEYIAEMIATDAQTDIAVLKIEASDLPYATMGSSDSLMVGQEVIAVGNPLGELGGTVTNGIISAVDRKVTVDNYTMTLIQTNAAISPGNSGGGLFDASGDLIAIVNAKYSDTDVEGLGFAIPIDIAMKSAQDLIDVGYVTGRINVGLNLLGINDQQTAFQYRVNQLGVYVYSTVDGSSAALAGFKTGDYIASADGVEIRTVDELKAIFNEHEVGDIITVHVIRGSEELDLDLILTEYAPASTPAA